MPSLEPESDFEDALREAERHRSVIRPLSRLETDEFGSLAKGIVATLERVSDQRAWADLVLAT